MYPARQRRPLPEISASPPSALMRRMFTPSGASEWRSTPSAPTPTWRSHNRRAHAATSAGASASATRRKSLPIPWALASLILFIADSFVLAHDPAVGGRERGQHQHFLLRRARHLPVRASVGGMHDAVPG